MKSAASRREGAVQSRAGLRQRYQAWLRHHRLSAADSLYRILDSLYSSLLTWLVIGIAIALPAVMSVALDNAQRLGSALERPAQMSLFLQLDVSEDSATAMQQSLSEHNGIAETTLVNRAVALEEFSAQSGFADVLQDLQVNPLPHLILVYPAVGVDPRILRDELLAYPKVEQVILDMEWLSRLQGLTTISQRLVYALGALLVFGGLLILTNTIRLAIESRREEIIVVKLMGGSNAFVRRPFLYTGLWYGVGSGVLAAFLVGLCLWFLQQPVRELAALYHSTFALEGQGFMGALNLVLLGGILGVAGAWLAVSRHLGEIAPR